MAFYDAYQAKLSVSRIAPLEYNKYIMKRNIQHGFFDSPSYKKVNQYSFHSPTVSNALDCWITDDSKNKEAKKIQAYPDQVISKGDLLQIGAEFWLLIIVDNMGDIYFRGTIQKCESTLKWLNAEGILKETPFTQKFTSTAYPLEEDKIMILSKERRNILVQANDDTLGIDKGQRFIFDRRCWKTVGFNGLTEGLLELTLEEDQINSSTDNVELRIADYYSKIAQYEVLVLNGSANSLFLDDTLQLNIRVTNRGLDIPTPLLHFSSSNENVVSVSESGLVQAIGKGEAIVFITHKDASSSININVTDRRTYNYTLDITGSDDIKIGRSQKYQVSFFNNGEPISDIATFSLTSLDGTPTQLATLKSLDNVTCEITAGKAIGRIVLHVSNQNGLITNKKEIKIKSLI